MSARESFEIVGMDATRLASGVWCHERNRMIGEGDVAASYSADKIAMEGRVRKPFFWRGGLWVSVGRSGTASEFTVRAYRLEAEQAFAGKAVSYGEKTREGDRARSDPKGFYHGMAVCHGGERFVLSGPPVVLVPVEPAQGELFDGL